MNKTAILVDGAFFLKRYRALTDDWRNKTPEDVARAMYASGLGHLRRCRRKRHQLYRIFYYDCPPLCKRVQHPITGKGISLGDSEEATFRLAYFDELKRLRKVALRLGHLSEHSRWEITNQRALKRLLQGKLSRDDLDPSDVSHVAKQVGVDMMIGCDTASLVFKKHVDQIILIAGDADFVPAAKLARREGVDFILDPMWNHIQPQLHEHVDGLQSTWRNPYAQQSDAEPST